MSETPEQHQHQFIEQHLGSLPDDLDCAFGSDGLPRVTIIKRSCSTVGDKTCDKCKHMPIDSKPVSVAMLNLELPDFIAEHAKANMIYNKTAMKIMRDRYLKHAKTLREDATDTEINCAIAKLLWRVSVCIATKNGAINLVMPTPPSADINCPICKIGTEAYFDAREYFSLMARRAFVPNSPVFTGCGTRLGQAAACFVLPVEDDLTLGDASIFGTMRRAARIQQTGGGVGFSFSKLRPSGSRIKSSEGVASGPASFIKVYNAAFGAIAQGGSRRGACMGSLRIDHPDIRMFIDMKRDTNSGDMSNFNLSVLVTDSFFEHVKKGHGVNSFPLIDPSTGKTVKMECAADLLDLIADRAHSSAEPGVLFVDEANRKNPTPELYKLETTNPCGEQWLGPYECCCLGSINFTTYVKSNGCGMYGVNVDWDGMMSDVHTAVRFLDSSIEANGFVMNDPMHKDAITKTRRIGLGITGLADVLLMAGVRYGSEKSLEIANQLMSFIHYHALMASTALAKEFGPFPEFVNSAVNPKNACDRKGALSVLWPYASQVYNGNAIVHATEIGCTSYDITLLLENIEKYGLRNAAVTTIAPTGTATILAGCEGNACEPIFAYAYSRAVTDPSTNEKRRVQFRSELLKRALEIKERSQVETDDFNVLYVKEHTIEKYILDQVDKDLAIVEETGSAQSLINTAPEIANVFVRSTEVSAREHLAVMITLQQNSSNSISKTINMPSDASVEDVRDIIIAARDGGCRGLTVYREGSRSGAPLVTKNVAKAKDQQQHQQQLYMPPPPPPPPSAVESEEPAKSATIGTKRDTVREFAIDTAQDDTTATDDSHTAMVIGSAPIHDVPAEEMAWPVSKQAETSALQSPKLLSPTTLEPLPPRHTPMYISEGSTDEYSDDSSQPPPSTSPYSRPKPCATISDAPSSTAIPSSVNATATSPAPLPLLFPNATSKTHTPCRFMSVDGILQRPSGKLLPALTQRVETPLGGATVVLVYDETTGEPFELYLIAGQAGGDVTSLCEAIGRACSLTLRQDGPMSRLKRLRCISEQYIGIGGRATPVRRTATRDGCCSLPDAVGKVLDKMVSELEHSYDPEYTINHDIVADTSTAIVATDEASSSSAHPPTVQVSPRASTFSSQAPPSFHSPKSSCLKFDLCPTCGAYAINVGAKCPTCDVCGYSKCS